MQAEEPHLAVIDIGSNSLRLVVYDRLSRAPFPRFNEKSFCGLARDLEETGLLPEDAVRQALAAVRRFVTIASAMGVGQIDILATEAVRRAANGGRFLAEIEAVTGIVPHLLSGLEEARFAAMGVLAGLWRPHGLVGDMGGGSLEVAAISSDGAQGEVEENRMSLPLGGLPVDTLMRRSVSAAKAHVDALLEAHLLAAPDRYPTFYMVGGGWRALARVHMTETGAPVRVAHGYTAPASSMRKLARRIWQMKPGELVELPGAPPRRLAMLPAAALVLDRVLGRLASERVVVSALGLREGWLYGRLDEAERRRDPLLEGARAVGAARSRVPAFAAALERWTDDLFAGETMADKRLRQAACALSDIAWTDHVDAQAQQSFRRLLQFPFIGLDHAERVWLAAAVHARYGGKRNDAAMRPAIDLLDKPRRRRALILGRAMLLAYRFSGSVPTILDASRLVARKDRLRLEVGAVEIVPDSDAVRARLERLAKALDSRDSEIVTTDRTP